MLPDPGEIFQLTSFHQFLYSPRPFSRHAAWLPGSRACGEARADVPHGDRGTEPFLLWSYIDLIDATWDMLPAAGWAQTPTRCHGPGGCRHFAPSALLQGRAVDEMLVQVTCLGAQG